MQSAARSHPTPRPQASDRTEVVFRARGLAKVYRMGEVQVHALRAVDLDLYRGGLVVGGGPVQRLDAAAAGDTA